MNTYRAYLNPGFIDPDDPKPPLIEFETTADLLKLEDVQKFNRAGSEFVMSDGYLMVLTKEGFYWWVVGKIGNPSEIDLPKWRGPKCQVEFADGSEKVVEGDEISSLCGEVVVLKDGTKTRRIR
jgi:hypothetical protein